MSGFSVALVTLFLVAFLAAPASGQIWCDTPSQGSDTTYFNIGNGTLFFELYENGVAQEAGSYIGGWDTFDDAVAVKINADLVQNYTSRNVSGNATDHSVVREIHLEFQPTSQGLILKRKIYFPANAPVGRWLEIIENPTDQNITVEFSLFGNFGHDSETNVWATSSNFSDTTSGKPWTTEDYWACFDDFTDPGVDEPDCVGYAWPGGLFPYYVNITDEICYPGDGGNPSDSYGIIFRFSIPPGEYRAILQVWAIGFDRANLLSIAETVGSFPEELLAGISDDERCHILNAPAPNFSCGDSGSPANRASSFLADLF